MKILDWKWKGKVNFETTPQVNGTNISVEGHSHSSAIHDDVASEISAITEKTTPVSADLILIEDSAASNAKKKVQLGNLPTVFGSEFSEGSSDGESSTTNTSFQQKLRLTTGSLPSGKYRVGWSYEWSFSSTSYDFKAQVQINDSTTIAEHQEEPQDSGSDQWHKAGGFYYHTGSGVLNIDIDYCRSSSSGGTAYIRRARLEIWRVS